MPWGAVQINSPPLTHAQPPLRSLPALLNVGSVLFLFMFTYAIAGMGLFGNIKFQEGISQHANLRAFPKAMLLLFRCALMHGWGQAGRLDTFSCQGSHQSLNCRAVLTTHAGS